MPRFIATTLIVILVAPLSARDIYVNNIDGDDLNTGLSETNIESYAGPVRTIAKALRIVAKGDRIVLAKTDAPYHESIGLCTGRHWGLTSRPLVIDGNGAILDGTAEVPYREWEFVRDDVFRFRPQLLSHQQLYLDGKPAVRRTFDPATRTWPKLEPLQWMLRDGYIYFRPETGKLPADYGLRYTALVTGVTLYHVRHVRIENLVVQGFQLDGINANDGVYDSLLVGVVCRGNGRSGVSIGGSSRADVLDSRIGDNGVAQIRTEGHCRGRIEGTEIIANTAPAYSVVGGSLWVDGKSVTSDDPALDVAQ